jgi:23S rRNA (guanosine2251-2'-O)-methyltransferase
VRRLAPGALNQLKIFSVTNLARTIKALKEKNIWVIGLDGSTETSLYQVDLTTPSAIIMGSEGSGLRSLTKKSCDQLAMIPMQGNIESLNVSVATGIALFEASRQRLN